VGIVRDNAHGRSAETGLVLPVEAPAGAARRPLTYRGLATSMPDISMLSRLFTSGSRSSKTKRRRPRRGATRSSPVSCDSRRYDRGRRSGSLRPGPLANGWWGTRGGGRPCDHQKPFRSSNDLRGRHTHSAVANPDDRFEPSLIAWQKP